MTTIEEAAAADLQRRISQKDRSRPAHRGERSMTREELVEALIDLGIDPDKFRGYGHITAGPLADALLERFELRPREENG
jgi:hypothetical protein